MAQTLKYIVRPIISNIKGPKLPISWLLARTLEPILKNVPAHTLRTASTSLNEYKTENSTPTSHYSTRAASMSYPYTYPYPPRKLLTTLSVRLRTQTRCHRPPNQRTPQHTLHLWRPHHHSCAVEYFVIPRWWGGSAKALTKTKYSCFKPQLTHLLWYYQCFNISFAGCATYLWDELMFVQQSCRPSEFVTSYPHHRLSLLVLTILFLQHSRTSLP